MILHSHAMDVHSRAEDLTSAIVGAFTPPQISAACAAVESFLRRHPHDQSRTFFSVAFPVLICRLFGFDDSSSSSTGAASPAARPTPPSPTGWVDQTDPETAAKVMYLLAPGGALFSAITSADRQALVRYVFPLERLPEWMRWALVHPDRCNGDVLPDICPLFKSRVRKDPVQKTLQLQLNAFEYFVFWFAYFPVCRGASEMAASTGSGSSGFQTSRKAARRFRIENWTAAWPVALASGRRRAGQKMDCSLYHHLLYTYLRAFVPKCSDDSTTQPYRSSLLHYTDTPDISAALQAEFMVHTFVHFWMVDNDFSPLSLNVCKSFGISFPFRKLLAEAPPTPGLGEPLKLLVRYLSCKSPASADAKSHQVEFSSRSAGWSTPKSSLHGSGKFKTELPSPEQLVGPWNPLLQRPLYRFIARTFLFCPIGASMKNAADVFSLWTTYLEPWKMSMEDFLELESPKQDAVQEGAQNLDQGKQDAQYTPMWQNYVASNYPFYSSLVMHFLSFAHNFLHTNVETIIRMVLKVVHLLASSNELVDLLKRIDAAYHHKSLGSATFKDNLVKFIPSIREQLQDWEDGLCENISEVSSRDSYNRDLQLFNEGDNGAQYLLQLLILRAETEIRTISAGNEQELMQDLSALRSGMMALFGGTMERFLSPIATRTPSNQTRDQREEAFTPKRQAQVKYQGDWMKRPVSDTEIAWLARHLVGLSDWLNRSLGLDATGYDEPVGPAFVELPANDMNKVQGAKDAAWLVFATLVSWVVMLVQSLLRFMRRRGLRINLRILASKKVAMALSVYIVISMLRRAVASMLWS